MQLEARLVELIRDQEGLDPLAIEMLVANIPAIRDLEEETKQAVIAQYDRHM